jgi:ubiquinone/menaquinone biosynthesis C-methylase UbiE
MSDAGGMFNDGAAYERSMGRWSRIAGEIFLDWLDAPKGLRWVDVGCGNGAFTEVLITRCAPEGVTGIDPSEGQLGFARTRPGTQMAQFHIGDAQALPFADGSFDAASMALVISFVSDPQKVADEMARVVLPGGLVATYMWDGSRAGSPLAPIHATIRASGIAAPVAQTSTASHRENLLKFWQRAGLSSIESREIRIEVVYPDFDDLWRSVSAPGSTTGAAFARIPQAEHERIKQRLRERLPARKDGRVAYEAFANAVKGRVPE